MNLPNRITLIRILVIPIIIAVFLIDFPYHLLVSAILFALASCTDFIDGYLARKNNMVTNLGKFLDPIADKVLVVVGLFLIMDANFIDIPYIAVICCIIIISRELIIGALRQIAAADNIILAADWWGKIKTVVTDFAIPFLFISDMHIVCYYIGLVLFLIATVLTLISGINYIVKNKHVFKNAD